MNIGKSIALLVWIVLLGGCNMEPLRMEATGKPYPSNPPPATSCRDLVCKVSVTVAIIPPPHFSCAITVTPAILDLSGGPSSQTIEWTLTTSGFKWPAPADGYLPVQFEPSAQGVISNLSISGDSLTITYTRPSTGGHRYGYGVNTKHPLLGRFCNIDPWIQD
jgi:hypothetical protein